MLGTIGFSVAAITFFIFGYTSYQLAAHKPKYDRSGFLMAYTLITLACLVWAIGTQLASRYLHTSVLIGDLLLLMASTMLLVTTLPQKWHMVAMFGGALATLGLLLLRIKSSGAEPALINNVLIFNTPKAFGVLLVVILYFVWVRANMYFFAEVIDKDLQVLLRPAYFSSNVFAFLGVSGFLFSRKDITVVTSFCIIVASFISLVMVNNYVKARSIRKAHG